MHRPATFDDLLKLARADAMAEIVALSNDGDRDKVTALVSQWRRALWFIDRLSPDDLHHFARAVAVFENTIGGLGSVTLLQHVVPRLDERKNETVKWIITNTRSFWYYEREYQNLIGDPGEPSLNADPEH